MSTFTATEMKSLNSLLANADLEDLALMGDLMKARRDLIGRMNMGTVTRGTQVKFKNRQGVYIQGTVEKVNRKKVVVTTNSGRWNVPGSMLEKV